MRLPRRAGRALSYLARAAGKFFLPTGRTLFRMAAVKPYELSLRLRHQILTTLRSSSTLELLRQREVVLFVVVLGMLAISANSWRVNRAVAEDFGQHNLLFPLIRDETEVLVTEDATNLVGGGTDQDNGDLAEFFTPGPLLTNGGTALSKPLLIETEPGIAARTSIEYHTIQPGDTLSHIAEEYGLQISTILWANNLTARSVLQVGKQLIILPVNGVNYRINKGDTIGSIAKRFAAKSEDIQSFNSLGNKLTVGDTIVIPGGRPQTIRPAITPTRVITGSAQSSSVAQVSSGRLLWPTVRRRLTQYYSWRHTGVDIADRVGTPIYAADSGTVRTAGWNRGGYGYYIIVDHGGGFETLYGHASQLLVKAGDHVERGDEIAEMGSTGRSTGPHLHFEVRIGGRRTNPLNYIR